MRNIKMPTKSAIESLINPLVVVLIIFISFNMGRNIWKGISHFGLFLCD